ncbi:MAG: recombination directionality factor, partial [Planctomycetota bacterium]
MENFKPQFTRISGLSDRRRLPRMGIIRLGLKVKNKKGVEYPTETDYFVCPDEVQKVYGEQPTQLDVMFPLNSIDSIFPQSLKWYGSTRGLKCQGNMQMAIRYDDKRKDWIEQDCPCELLEQNKCKQTGILMFMLPTVSMGGIYQIRTSSYHSIVDINSGLDFVSALTNGRFDMVKLQLRREKTETHHDGKKQTHYTLKLFYDGDLHDLQKLRLDSNLIHQPQFQLPAPIDENPEFDPPDVIDEEESSENEASPENQETPGNQETDKEKSITPGLDYNNLVKALNQIKQADATAFLHGKRIAKITKKVENCTPEELERLDKAIKDYYQNQVDN